MRLLKNCRHAAVIALLPSAGGLAVGSRYNHISTQYVPLRKDASLFDPATVSTWLDSRFLHLADCIARGHETPFVVQEVTSEVYTFPLLTKAACRALADEVANFGDSGLEARRPNSMNNYGIVLNDIGLRPSLDELQALVQPVAQALFPREGTHFDDHHSFCVSYRADQDKGLDMHTDDSDITLNVCLGDEFVASGLTFCGSMGAPDHRKFSASYQHRVGQAVLHLGRRRHGADDIKSGHRINLIMWNYNKQYRSSPAYRSRSQFYAKEDGPPSPECTSYTHDRDYVQVRGDKLGAAELERAARYARATWCPPPPLEYDGFKGGAGRYQAVDPFHRDLMD